MQAYRESRAGSRRTKCPVPARDWLSRRIRRWEVTGKRRSLRIGVALDMPNGDTSGGSRHAEEPSTSARARPVAGERFLLVKATPAVPGRAEHMKVMTILGTRPEAIKLAPVILELRERIGADHCVVCTTGQHRFMVQQVLDLFEIVPRHDLQVMRNGQSPLDVAAAVLTLLGPVLDAERPDWVLVQGDTTSAMAASLAAAYRQVRVGHVEAGLRTYDRGRPFPEEINRRITGVLADLHFAPTIWARDNLLREGERPESIVVTGNPVIDALKWVAARTPEPPVGILASLPTDRRLILVTTHRRENFGAPLASVCEAVLRLAKLYSEDVHLVLPVHPNPDVRSVIEAALGATPNITLTEPLPYQELVYLLTRVTLVLTDSGGIQEEAPGLGRPVLVLREVTERPEGVEAGTVRLVGTDADRIVAEVRRLLDDPVAHAEMARAVNPYGDGHAASRIVGSLY